MNIIVNGKDIMVNVKTLNELIEHYGLLPEHVVAEVDGQVIDRKEWEKYDVTPGARIELVHFVGGG